MVRIIPRLFALLLMLGAYCSPSQAQVCAGAPPAITATSTVSAGCAGQPFIVYASGAQSGVSGFTYFLQSNTGSGFTTTMGPQLSSSFMISSQTVASSYRIFITCTNSNLSDTSNIVAIGQRCLYRLLLCASHCSRHCLLYYQL